MEKYSIKQGYHHAVRAGRFDDTVNKDEWQKEVYLFVAAFMKQHDYFSVMDIGCGSAYKLVHYLGQYDTTCIELEATWHWLQKTYPGKKWLNRETQGGLDLKSDLVICCDVIEHTPDPESLILFINNITSKHIIFSTPERDIIAGRKDFGPPENSSHYREWNAEEFHRFISKWFVVESQHLIKDRSASQVIICRKIER